MKRLYILTFVQCVWFATASETAPASSRLSEALEKLDAHYEEFLDPWLARQWDPATGGQLRYPSSAEPDIQSSAQLTSILETAGLIETMPDHARAALVGYFQSRQNSDDGFFYDYPDQDLADRDKGRYLGYTINALRRLGAAPLHPLPDDESSGVPPHLQSRQAFRAWLDALPWETPWGAGDKINSQGSIIDLLSHKDELLAELWLFLPTKQNPTTGYWGASATETNYNYLSGAAKITFSYAKYDKPIPMAAQLYDSAKTTLFEEPAIASTHVRNVLWLIRNLMDDGSLAGGIPEEDRVSIIDKTAANIGSFLMPDGGFRNRRNSESGMDAASQARHARNWSLTVIAGLGDSAPWPGADTFWAYPSFLPPGVVSCVKRSAEL